jgi:predicted HicB family RNase H-like nuclease
LATIESVPRRPHVAVVIRFPPEIHAQMVEAAEREDRSLTAQVIHVMRQWLEQQERERREQERQDDRPPG